MAEQNVVGREEAESIEAALDAIVVAAKAEAIREAVEGMSDGAACSLQANLYGTSNVEVGQDDLVPGQTVGQTVARRVRAALLAALNKETT